MNEFIQVKGARVNNLKNVSLDIPRDRLIVITGLSGSGKSSLAFDTLYAEGQRRYVESLSAYARQFLGRMHKPECDYIKGLPPAIAIEQKTVGRNPRSTVGTQTEIYDYLRLLFARCGHTFSPVSGQEVKRHTPEDVLQAVQQYAPGTRFTILAPLCLQHERSRREQLEACLAQGIMRIDLNGQILRIEDYLQGEPVGDEQPIYLVIDRMSVGSDKEFVSRFIDSAETAFSKATEVVPCVSIRPICSMHFPLVLRPTALRSSNLPTICFRSTLRWAPVPPVADLAALWVLTSISWCPIPA